MHLGGRFAFLLGCFSGLGSPLVADPVTAPGDEATGVFHEGAGAEDAQTEPSTGALRYTYPFRLPPARGAVQPELALV